MTQLDWLELTIWGEARGESDHGMLAVAFVIMNRSRDGDIINTVLRPYQFSFWNTDDPSRPKIGQIDRTSEIWKRIQRAAACAYYRVVDDPTRGCTSYLNPDACTPRQMKAAGYTEAGVRERIGRHHFFIAI